MADYKAYGRSEDLLEKHLPAFDNNLNQKTIQEACAQMEQIGRFMVAAEPKQHTIRYMNRQPAYWETPFSLPVIQYVPKCFRFITKHFTYIRRHGFLQFLELVPSYLPNMNHVTLLNSYNGGNPEFVDNPDDILKKYVFEKGTQMEMSSLNKLLKRNSIMSYLTDDVHSTVKMSFELCYWRPPSPGDSEFSCINNLIYHSHERIHNVLMFRKTLVKVLKIDDEKTERSIFYTTKKESKLTGKYVDVRHAEVLILCDDGMDVSSKKERVYLTKDVADSVEAGDIFNAVMVMGRMPAPDSKIGRPFVIGKIGKTVKPGDIKCILALELWRMLRTLEDDTSLTLVTSLSQASARVTETVRSNSEMFSYENFSPEMVGWTRDLPKKISKCIEEMFPMYQTDGENIYQLSPTIMSFLACNQPELLQDRKAVMLIMKLFHLPKVNQKDWESSARMKLRTSDPYDDLQKSFGITGEILNRSKRLHNRIVYARILSQHWA